MLLSDPGSLVIIPADLMYIGTMAAQLVAIDGPLKGQVCPLFEAQLSIGRSVVNRLPITNDPFVSREHCVIRESEGELVVEDLNMQNGTFAHGLLVKGA